MYNCSQKVIDRNKAIVNRFVAELYTDGSVKVLLEAPTMMGIRMAMSSGDNSDYHVVNVAELPDMQTPFLLTRHQGTLLSILNSGVLPMSHVFYADYCGAPVKTSGPIAKDPALEAKLIYNHLLPRGVGIFTFCRRGCKSADKVAEKLLAPYFKIATVHTYSNMMVYIGVKRTASDKVVSDIKYQFEAVKGKYWSRSCELMSAEEKALVMVHHNKDMKCMKVHYPEECEACLCWFNDQEFLVNTSATSTKDATACICTACWEDGMPTDSYEIKNDKCVWKSHMTRQNEEHEVFQWLTTLELGPALTDELFEQFCEQGIDSMHLLCKVNESFLEEIGVKRFQRMLLMSAIEELTKTSAPPPVIPKIKKTTPSVQSTKSTPASSSNDVEKEKESEDEESDEDEEELPYNLRYINETRLSKFKVQALRQECIKREIEISSGAHKTTCISKLLDWKKCKAITGKKRVFRTSKSTDETREKRKNAAAKRRKTEYEATAKEAKPLFDKWFKEEVTVNLEFKDTRIGKEELEEQYVEWHTNKDFSKRLLLSTKAKKEGMHFSTEVLKRINATLKRKKNNLVTFVDNGASVACFPYISHEKITHKK